MNPYICVTYAHDDRQQSELFFRSLSRYGFRYNCVSELSTHDRRGALLGQSAILIALTSEAASRVETVASDIRHALEKGLGVLCVSLKDNELDPRRGSSRSPRPGPVRSPSLRPPPGPSERVLYGESVR